MKKVCFLIGNIDNFGGTERVTSIIANNLAKKGYDITIASITNGDSPFFSLDQNIRTLSLSSAKGKSSFTLRIPLIIRNLRKVLIEHSIETLIVVDTFSIIISLPAVSGLEVRHIGWEHFNFKSNLNNRKRWVLRRVAARYFDTIITLTSKDKEFWMDNAFNKARIITIPNPCPYTVQDNDYSKNANNIVLAVGRLTSVKGFDMLLQAWKEVVSQRPKWRLRIVGDGEDANSLIEYIETNKLNKSVEMVGKVSNIDDYYQNADIFCLSSRAEGFPMVLLEALSFGLPVVSFNCETGPEEILKDTGSLLVPKNDVTKLSQELILLMDDKDRRNTISYKSKIKAKQYQPSQIISHWEDLLNET